MNNSTTLPLSPSDVRELKGRIVLVKSARDRRNPPSAMRGWLEVHDVPGPEPTINVAVEFPQMFSRPAHHRVYPLDDAGLVRLLETERNGTFTYTVDDDLV